MTVDPATFRESDIQTVYAGRRVCFQTSKEPCFEQPVDGHHILGRSLMGDRMAASSILNLAWLRRDIHEGPLRDRPDQQRVYLGVALRNVLASRIMQEYRWNDADRVFFLFIREYRPQFADLYEGI